MICEICGTEHQERPYTTAETVECRDALSTQLASMTKRAVDLDHSLGIAQRGWEVAREDAHAFRVERDVAEAKLATAAEALIRAHCDLRWYEGFSGKGSVALAENSAVGFDGAWEKRTVVTRAIGIDPSKEQKK